MAIIPIVTTATKAADLVHAASDLLDKIGGGSRSTRSKGTRTRTNANLTKLRQESEAADAALAQLLAVVEEESQEADEALAAHLSAVTQQQASLVRWLIVLSVVVVITGLLAFAAILGLVITIAVLA